MKRMLLTLLAVSLSAAMLWGCGSNRSSDGAVVGDGTTIEDAANVGRENCEVCHSLSVHTEFSGIAGINPDSSGLPSAIEHDCEACHGGGQYHSGVGPIPYPSPDASRCVACHEEQTNAVLSSKHNAEEPENVEMIATSHDEGYCQRCHTAEGAFVFADVIGPKALYNATIVPFGTTPGAGQVEALDNLDAEGNPVLHNPTCAACHNPLALEIVSISGWDPNQNGSADQFDMCTSCHILKLNDGTLLGSGLPLEDGAGDPTEEFYHNTAWYRTLLSTHRDNPDTGSVGDNDAGRAGIQDVSSNIEGYVIRENSPNPCFDCHSHDLLTNTSNLTRVIRDPSGYKEDPNVERTIYTDWAKSAHAGRVLQVKYAAQMTGNPHPVDPTAVLRDERMTQLVSDAAADDTTGEGWTHYNWDRTGRGTCQRCHTSTGLMNFLADTVGYDYAANDFSHLFNWTGNEVNGSPQNEMLYCWGCHSNAETGALRDDPSGKITLDFVYEDPAGPVGDPENIELTDKGDSNVCVACHAGRGNDTKIRDGYAEAAAEPLPADRDLTGRFAGHHAPTAGSLFAAETHTGFEYDGKDYTTPALKHDEIDAAEDGPCVSCHMGGPDHPNHTFEPVTEDESGDITAINNQSLCSNAACHGTGGMTPASLNTLRAEFDAARQILLDLVDNTIVNHLGLDISDSANLYTDTLSLNDYGAFQNSLYVTEEPCIYLHNSLYAKRLLFDSIDWLEDESLDGTIADYGADDDWLGGTTRP